MKINLPGLLLAVVSFVTTSGFSQWDEVPVPTTNHFYAVDIYDDGTCFAGGIAFVKSTDYGNTWNEVVYTGPNAFYLDLFVIYSIDIIDANTIVCAGWHGTDNNNVITRSTNGGLDWTVEYAGAFGNGKQFNRVTFYDALNGIAVGEDGLIFRTTDGGDTWAQVPSGVFLDLFDVCYTTSANHLVAVGTNRVLTSSNGGTSWSVQTYSNKDFMSVQYEPVSGEVTAVYNNASSVYLFTSTTNGATWTDEQIYEDWAFCHEVIDQDTIHFGNENIMFVTHNDCEDMFYMMTNDLYLIRDIEFNAGTGLAVTAYDNGRIFRYNYAEDTETAPDFDFTYPSTICLNQVTQYVPSNASVDSYEWLVDGVSVSTDDTLEWIHTTAGAVTVTLEATHNGTTYDEVHNVFVNSPPVVSAFTITGDTTRCVGQTGSFTVNNIAGQTGFQVFKNGVPINFTSSSGNNRTYNLGVLSTGFEIKVTKWSINSCDSSALEQTFNFIVEAYESPALNFYMLDTLLCLNDSSVLVVPITMAGYSYQALNNGVAWTSAIADGDTLEITTPSLVATHTFTVKVTSPFSGCLTTLTNSEVTSVDPVDAGFQLPLPYVFAGDPLPVNTTGVIGNQFNWQVSGNPSVFSGENTLNPTIVYDTIGQEWIELNVENSTGCVDSLLIDITLVDHAPDSLQKEVCWLEEKNLPIIFDQHVDPFGNVIVVGYRFYGTFWWGPKFLACIQKYNTDGDLLWEWDHPSTGPGEQYQRSVMLTSVTTDLEGNIYMCGSFEAQEFNYQNAAYYWQGGTSDMRSFVMKLTGDGDFVWWTHKYSPHNSSFADVLYDYGTDNLFVSAVNMSGVYEFTDGPEDLSPIENLAVLHLDTAGAFKAVYDLETDYNNIIGEIQPSDPHSNRRGWIAPYLLMSSDKKLFMCGEILDEELRKGSTVYIPDHPIPGPYERSYIAKLEPYGSSPGWIDVVETGCYSFQEYGDEDYPAMRVSMDINDNIYVALNSSNASVDMHINSDTLNVDMGSAISKWDPDLNHVWTKVFEPVFIKDILCSNSQDIYFIGRATNYFLDYENEIPTYMVNSIYPDNMILGSFDENLELTWLEEIGQEQDEQGSRISGNYCGDVFITGKCNEDSEYWHAKDTVNVELSGVNYGNIFAGFMMKLTDSLCISGGCQTLCSNPSFLPNPSISVTDTTLQVGIYSDYQWFFNGDTIAGATAPILEYTQNGDYTVVVTDANGCQGSGSPASSCLNTSLFVAPVVTYTFTELSTGTYASYQWYLDGIAIPGATLPDYTYTQNGLYSVVVTDAAGCSGEGFADTTCLNAAFMVSPVITESGGVLNAGAYDSYQWYLDGVLIPGADNAAFTYSSNGLYTVEVTDLNGCGATSAGYSVSGVGLLQISNQMEIYPNPATGVIFIRSLTNDQVTQVRVLNAGGQLCVTSLAAYPENSIYELDVTGLGTGVYFITIYTESSIYQEKIMIK